MEAKACSFCFNKENISTSRCYNPLGVRVETMEAGDINKQQRSHSMWRRKSSAGLSCSAVTSKPSVRPGYELMQTNVGVRLE